MKNLKALEYVDDWVKRKVTKEPIDISDRVALAEWVRDVEPWRKDYKAVDEMLDEAHLYVSNGVDRAPFWSIIDDIRTYLDFIYPVYSDD